ncbi:MAG: DUF6702 family protein [Saprospiraceae bacterium]
MLFSILFTLLSFFPRPSSVLEDHPFHVSKCEVEFTKENPNVQIALHVFIDDLELALERHKHSNLQIGTLNEDPKSDEYILEYLRKSFMVEIQGKMLNYEMLGKEMTKDLAGIWVYLEVPEQGLPKNVSITYSLLTEVFDDQQNLINIKVNDSEKQYGVFMKNKPTQSFAF